jgi:RNA polymerase sigma factor (sigma-70 family)
VVFLVLSCRLEAAQRIPVLLAWLHQVCCHVCKDSRRAAMRRHQHERSNAMPVQDVPVTESAELERVDAALASLKPRQREAVSLHVLAGKTPGQVADDLGISTANAYNLIQRGLASLRSKLAP